MIQVYLSTNTNFDKNGDMSLQPLSYEVSTAGINQAVEFTIEHEIDEYGRYEYLQKGNVIKAFTPWDLKKGQLFRIEDIDKDSKEGTIIASGYLIFYDNVKTYVKDFNNENVLICDTGNTTGEEAIKKIFKNTNYIGHSNIMRISRSRLERKNIVAALTGDDENSFVNRWGGELFIDNFDIYMNEKIGHDTGLIISYGRNMEYIKESSSYKNTITRIIPIGFDGLRLTGKTPWVDSPNINKYPYIMEKEIKFDQVKVKEENSNIYLMINNSIVADLEIKDEIKRLFNIGEISTNDMTYLSNARSIALLKKSLNNINHAINEINNNNPIEIVELSLKESWNN